MSKLDATVERELQVVDEALARGAVTAAADPERELQEIALAVAAQAPEPDPAFSAELHERVRAGFPREGRASRLSLPALPKLRRPPMIALAGVASVLAAVAVAVPLLSGGDGETGATSGANGAKQPTSSLESDSAAPGARREAVPPASDIAPVPPVPPPDGGGGFAPGQSERRIERSASLTLEAPEGKLDRVAGDIVTVTDRYDGFVLRSNVTSGDDGIPGGQFELRIPADRLQAALRDLSKLGKVRSQSQSGEDVTRAFVSAADSLEGARAERRSLLRRLENAESDAQAESIRQRLDLNASEIRGLRGQLRDLRLRTDYSQVNVTLEGSDKGDGESSGAADDEGLRGALDDAVGSLSDSVEVLVRALGVLVPLSLLAALAWFAGRTVRRHRRESALSA